MSWYQGLGVVALLALMLGVLERGFQSVTAAIEQERRAAQESCE